MQVNVKLQVGETIGFFVVFALALFLPAGTLAWQAGWVFLLLFFSFYIAVNVWLFRHNPGLIQERLHFGTTDQQGWDKVLFPLFEFLSIAWLAFMAIDAVRFHWSSMPVWIQVMGAVILLGSFYLLFLTFRENSYLSPVVRIQEERGQTVISTGPYHYVRHPMYIAILVFYAGASILLGSVFGLLFGILFTLILARRAVLEERTLQEKLPGYTSYMAKVKYRFVPFLW
jgi:protein-S-isoprenylcysteine O-methyltransferase Ste14